MRYIKFISNLFGRKHPQGYPKPATNRPTTYRKAGATAKTCKECNQHKNVKHFYATTGKA